jgi:hypothetical protein
MTQNSTVQYSTVQYLKYGWKFFLTIWTIWVSKDTEIYVDFEKRI